MRRLIIPGVCLALMTTTALAQMPRRPPPGGPAALGQQVDLQGTVRAFTMTPAVCFVTASGQDHDPNGLVGLVKSKRTLDEMGAEQVSSSVIYNDTAYDVIDGFIGEPMPP